MDEFLIPVYASEIADGLEESIQSFSSAKVICNITKKIDNYKLSSRQIQKDSVMEAMASFVETLDLFYMEDILVTTNTNLNLDHFLPEEVWKARNTPVDKPFNFEHVSSDIIGHIISSHPVDDSLTEISDDTEIKDLPSEYHLRNGSVIYLYAGDADRRKLIADTVQEIKDDEWAVSMECLMRDFDYLLINTAGVKTVVPRNEQTAWMTKHLINYEDKKTKKKGTGTFKDPKTKEEYIVGRVPRNFTFSGKGLVRKPANPKSVIIQGSAETDPKPTVIELEKPKMDELKEIINQLKAEVTTLKAEKMEKEKAEKAEKVKKEEADKKEKDDKEEKWKKKEADYDEEADASKKTIAQLEAELKTAKSTLVEVEAKLSVASETVKALQTEKSVASRKAALDKANAPDEVAAKMLKEFADLSDTGFASVVELASPSWKVTAPSTPFEAAAAVIDSKINETSAPALATDPSPKADQAVLGEAIASHFGKTSNRKFSNFSK